MGLNVELIYAHIREIEQALARLDGIVPSSRAAFLSNQDLEIIQSGRDALCQFIAAVRSLV